MLPPFAQAYDVIIAGAGPVGLLLACELRLGGCSVLLLEQADDPETPLKRAPFGMRGLSVPTIENLDRRDLLSALVARGPGRRPAQAVHEGSVQRSPIGHFAGIEFFQDQIDDTAWPWRLTGPIASLATDIASLEAVLTERAEALGVEIRRGCPVREFEQGPEGVVVRADGKDLRALWLVGCDGGRSTIRKASGIGFPGTDPEFTGYFLHVNLADPDMLEPDRHRTATGMYVYSRPGIIAMVDFDGGAFHRTDAITREHVETVLRRVTGKDVRVNVLHLASTWTDRACQANTYRSGRVLLAGDAAHIHSPLGGQGLNLGLGDAMNLGWKLAATTRGEAPDGLLDTYERERAPVAAQVLDRSRAQSALMRPGPGSCALETIVRDLIGTGDGATYFADRVCGLGLRYDLGDSHPLVGRSAPDFALADGVRLNDHLRDGRAVLLDTGGHPSLRMIADRCYNQVAYVLGDAKNELGASVLLIRPDGIVAWAGMAGGDGKDAISAISRWLMPAP